MNEQGQVLASGTMKLRKNVNATKVPTEFTAYFTGAECKINKYGYYIYVSGIDNMQDLHQMFLLMLHINTDPNAGLIDVQASNGCEVITLKTKQHVRRGRGNGGARAKVVRRLSLKKEVNDEI